MIKHAGKSTGGKPRVCGCLVLPEKGLAWERWWCTSPVSESPNPQGHPQPWSRSWQSPWHLPAHQQLPSSPTGLLGHMAPACLQFYLAFSPSSGLKTKNKRLTMDFCHCCDAQRAFFLCFRFCFCFASVLSKIAAPSKE